jgi:hypothetical protein
MKNFLGETPRNQLAVKLGLRGRDLDDATNAQVVLNLKRYSAPLTSNDFLRKVSAEVKYRLNREANPVSSFEVWTDSYAELHRFTSDFADIVNFLTLPPGWNQRVPLVTMDKGALLHLYFAMPPPVYFFGQSKY